MTRTKPTQKDRVLELLDTWGEHGVCGTLFLKAHIPRYAARIHVLRDEGHMIERFRCRDGWHQHQSAQWKYRLRPEFTGEDE